jgi:DNA-binding Xre family transcriptional regulator
MLVKNRITEVLRKKGMKPTELAAKTGLSDSYISRVTSRHVANITVITAFKISNALDVGIEDVFFIVKNK